MGINLQKNQDIKADLAQKARELEMPIGSRVSGDLDSVVLM